MKLYSITVALLLVTGSPALAAPGVGQKVYGATVEAGVSEIESRYGRLVGGPADGEDAAVIELSHGFSNQFYAAALFELEREPGGNRRLTAVGAEGIVALGHLQAIDADVAVYGEYERARGDADKVETKLLVQHRRSNFDGRVNVIAEKQLKNAAPAEFGYAASADWQLAGEFRVGVEAFGDLGSTRKLFTRSEHFAGPILKTELEHLPKSGELEVEAGYLFALGAARDRTRGQARLLLEYEFHF